MIFSSLIFLFLYLPLTLTSYFLAPRRWKNTVLFVLSLIFYAWGEPLCVFLMLASITSAYGFGFLIERDRETAPRRAKWLTAASVAVSLSFLLFFKYYNFFAENLSRVPLVSIPVIAHLALPIGISFYTFQIISYTVDLYRGDCCLQRNYIAFGTYVTLFPQLVAGPIVRYREIDRQFSCRRETAEGFARGVSRFSAGLCKKVLIGDALAAGYAYMSAASLLSPSVLGAWIAAIFFTLHLYYDFSGYSDMAIGMGQMLGFDFPENFRYPYVSRSIAEFWRRWHISLSTWFREYIYIPLGGNRRGRFRTYRNLAVVWLLTGFWHGANWNFVLWGVYFAVLLILEKAFLGRILERLPALFQHLYALFLVIVGFVLFSHTDLSEAWRLLSRMLGFGGVSFANPSVLYRTRRTLPLLLIASVGVTPLLKCVWERMLEKRPRMAALTPILCTAALLLSTAYLVDSTFLPFAYAQF